jgi:pimeloyl-ACP methyl ester carboxylesterase
VRVVVLHDLGSTGADAVARLGLDGTGCAVPDLRGHGADDRPIAAGSLDLDAVARDLALDPALSDPAHPDPALRGEPVALVGLGLGAAVALRVAVLRPEAVAALVAVLPSGTDRPLPAHLRAYPVIGELLARYGPYDGATRFRRTGLFHAVELTSAAAGAALLAQFRAPRARERAARLVDLPREPALREGDAAAVAGIPTTVIAASGDPLHPVDVARLWAARLPHAALVEVEATRDPREAARRLRAAVARALPR